MQIKSSWPNTIDRDCYLGNRTIGKMELSDYSGKGSLLVKVRNHRHNVLINKELAETGGTRNRKIKNENIILQNTNYSYMKNCDQINFARQIRVNTSIHV